MASCFFVSEPSVDDPGDAGLGVVAAAIADAERHFAEGGEGVAGSLHPTPPQSPLQPLLGWMIQWRAEGDLHRMLVESPQRQNPRPRRLGGRQQAPQVAGGAERISVHHRQTFELGIGARQLSVRNEPRV